MIIWEVFYEVCNKMIKKDDPHRLLAFSINNVMYAAPLNINPPRISKALDILVCEIKKYIIYKSTCVLKTPVLTI
jgi:hypothetical protein